MLALVVACELENQTEQVYRRSCLPNVTKQYCQPRTTPIMELNSKSGVEPPILELGKVSNPRIEAGDPDDKILHLKRFMNLKSDLKYSYKNFWKR